MKRIVSALDMYAHPISVNFKQQSNYPTKLGALISIAIHAIFIAFTAFKFKQLVLKENPTIMIAETGQDTWNIVNSYNLKHY
jgi:hypothetical protein